MPASSYFGFRQVQRKLTRAARLLQETRAQLQEARLQAAAAQMATSAQTLALLHNHAQAVLLADAQLQIVLLTPACCQLLGLSAQPASYYGQPMQELLQAASSRLSTTPTLAALHQQTVRQQARLVDQQVLTADGRHLTVNYLPVLENGSTILHLWTYQDVTRQEQLREHIAQLSRLAEHSPHPIICFTAAAHPQYYNPAAQPLLEAMAAEHNQATQQFLHQEITDALATGATRVSQHPLAGRVYYWTVVPILHDGCINVYVADYTEQQTLQQAFASSQRLLDQVLTTVPNVIYVYDLQLHQVTYCNRFMYGMLGYTEQQMLEVIAEGWQKFLPDQEFDAVMNFWQEMRHAADGETRSLEYRVYHRNGQIHHVRTVATPLERDAEGHVRLATGSVEDITRWKHMEEQRRTTNQELANKNRLFQQIINASPYPIFIKDGTGRYVMANQATADLFYLSRQRLMRADHRQLVTSRELREQLQAQDRQVIATRKAVTAEVNFIDARGTERWLFIIKSPFILPDGSVQVLGMASDISNQKRIQSELQTAKETAEQTARIKQEFLTNISHEIRTPMHGIMGVASLLERTTLSDEQHEYVLHIQESAENLLVVINDVLDVSQLNTGKIRLEERVFDVRDVLRRSFEAIRFRAKEKHIALHLELPAPEQSTQVLGDPYRLTQIVLNLLGNAVKFTHQGHVTLRCELLPARANDAAQWFALMVEDTGIGIPAQKLEEMFDPFTQASASTARRYGGTGLGLSISKGLVELLGGTISAHSALQKGSTFRVELPLRPMLEQVTPVVPAATQLPLGPHRVLLVEDNAVSLFLTKKLLANWGLVTDVAAGGAEALEQFQRHTYALVLMDIQMPDMDGITTTQHLRQHPNAQRAATPVVALTANALPDQAEQYKEAGFAAYLSKPFSDEELYQLLRRYLPEQVSTEENLFDLKNIQQVAQGDEAFIRHMLQLFIDTVPPALVKLEHSFAQQDWKRVAEMAHHLKSSFYSLNIRSLHEPIRELESSAKQPLANAVRLGNLIGYVREVSEKVAEQLRQDLAQRNSEGA